MCYPKTLLNPLYIQLKQPDSMKQFFLKLGPERQSFVRAQCHIKPYITCYKICNKLHHFQASIDMTQHAEMLKCPYLLMMSTACSLMYPPSMSPGVSIMFKVNPALVREHIIGLRPSDCTYNIQQQNHT